MGVKSRRQASGWSKVMDNMWPIEKTEYMSKEANMARPKKQLLPNL